MLSCRKSRMITWKKDKNMKKNKIDRNVMILIMCFILLLRLPRFHTTSNMPRGTCIHSFIHPYTCGMGSGDSSGFTVKIPVARNSSGASWMERLIPCWKSYSYGTWCTVEREETGETWMECGFVYLL